MAGRTTTQGLSSLPGGSPTPRPWPGKPRRSPLASAGGHDGAGNLVVPSLLAGIPDRPQQPEVAGHRRDHQAEVTQERLAHADVRAGGRVDNVQMEDALADRAAARPKQDEVEDLHRDQGEVDEEEGSQATGHGGAIYVP